MKALNVLIISILSILIGILIGEALLSGTVIELVEGDEMTFLEELDNPGIQFFFHNNIIFFLIISILPFINMPIVVVQLFITGLQVSFVQGLPFQLQFELFYRHLFFEFLALMLAICVSYKNYLFLKDIHQVKTEGRKKKVVTIVAFYIGILLLTLVAAFLEGRSHV